jgi:hypothetical protein
MEPLSGTTTAAASAGFITLLIATFGPVGADVMMVVMAALTGAIIRLTSRESQGFWDSFKFIIVGIMVSLVLTWALAGLVISWVPSLAGQYTSSIIAFVLGFSSDKIPSLMSSVIKRINIKISSGD